MFEIGAPFFTVCAYTVISAEVNDWTTARKRERLLSELFGYIQNLAGAAQIFDIFDFTGDRSSCATDAGKQGIYLPMTTVGPLSLHMPQTHMLALPVLPLAHLSHPFFSALAPTSP